MKPSGTFLAGGVCKYTLRFVTTSYVHHRPLLFRQSHYTVNRGHQLPGREKADDAPLGASLSEPNSPIASRKNRVCWLLWRRQSDPERLCIFPVLSLPNIYRFASIEIASVVVRSRLHSMSAATSAYLAECDFQFLEAFSERCRRVGFQSEIRCSDHDAFVNATDVIESSAMGVVSVTSLSFVQGVSSLTSLSLVQEESSLWRHLASCEGFISVMSLRLLHGCRLCVHIAAKRRTFKSFTSCFGWPLPIFRSQMSVRRPASHHRRNISTVSAREVMTTVASDNQAGVVVEKTEEIEEDLVWGWRICFCYCFSRKTWKAHFLCETVESFPIGRMELSRCINLVVLNLVGDTESR